jgi:PE family
MPFLFTRPEILAAAATDLANIGSTLKAASSAAAPPTTGVLAAGADEVSAAVAALFGARAQQYQALSAQAAELHSQFVQTMAAAGAAYAGAEATNALPL